MKELLCLGLDERRTIGILGPSGIGKTTIARILHNQISYGFELSIFMKFKPSYARPTSSDDHDVKLLLEQQFLSQLLNQEDFKIPHLGAAQNFLKNKKVLLVLDGVDQLLGPGTRTIITTQNKKLLKASEIKHIYKVNFPPFDEAFRILCMNAFGQNLPYDGFKDLATEVTILAVMGSHFQGMSKQEWKRELPRLRIRLDGEIRSILKFSYDALDEEDKDLFLHIACFFNDEGINHLFEDTLRHKFSDVWQGIRVLVQRSLISNHKHFPMHNLLIQLGREIVRNQSIYEPGKRQFLVDAKDICEVLTDNTGSRSVIGIKFDFSTIKNDQNISERAFEEMPSLQFLSFHCGYVNPEFLVTIKLYYSKLKNCGKEFKDRDILAFKCLITTKLVVGCCLYVFEQPLRYLKLMTLHYSAGLKRIPDLSTATNLYDLNLNGCSSLLELPSIGNGTNPHYLGLSGCSSLVKLPSSIGNATNLQQLSVDGCSSLVELPSSIGNIISLQQLFLNGCKGMVELPNSIGNLTNMYNLNLFGCSSLVGLPSSIGDATNLS
ncbi:hypothetical protein EUTSA_v10011939mg [Eutrema salsugineum]|uniref:AAA+ ATPase domain-containing protein n=1 Tax=Eutrema salsugineum TaxID=72664 RepID=V4MHY0_EUTSA|nr:hypothetical protein EUTSA_v10011939mg [Eutrema salsugineum]